MPCATFASTFPIAGRIWMQATFNFASSLVVEPDESIALRSHAREKTLLESVLRFAGALATLWNLAPAGEERLYCGRST
jgi:hypothetical protein